MEFSSLREQRRQQAPDQVEARAAAAAAAAAEEETATRPSTSTRTGEDAGSRRRQRKTAASQPEDAASSTVKHMQPIEDGSLPSAGLGSSTASSTSSTSSAEQTAPPDTYSPPSTPPPPVPSYEQQDSNGGDLRPHNLLRATEILQEQTPTSLFAPAPILRLNAIQISGAANAALRPGFLASMCRPYMDSSISSQTAATSGALNTLLYGGRTSHVLPGQPTTLPSILSLTSSLAGDLDKLDVFTAIEATLAPSLAPGAGEEDVDILLNCGKPRGRVFLKSSTDVGNGEGSASIQGRIRNVFGGAETLQGSASFGTRTKQAFNVEFGAPMPGNVDNEVKVSGFSLDRDLSSFASCSESVQGVRAALSTSRTSSVSSDSGSADVQTGAQTQHEIAYEASLRHLGRLLPDASIAVRKLAVSPSVKSAVSWTYTRDSRDHPILPSRGMFTKTALEYAGLGGDASHLKAEMEAATGRCYLPVSVKDGASAGWLGPVNATFGIRAGMLHGLDRSGSTHFSDRFHLGGPTSIRMFRLNSLGPKDKTDSLGGTAFWALGASFLTPIPHRHDWPLKLHAFANAGQLCQLSPARFSPAELRQPSTSVGLGFVYLQGPLRVEFNVGLPMSARTGDAPRKGLQFGIGIQFL